MNKYRIRFQGLVCRAINPLWSFAPDSGEGAALHGGRFNPVKVPALYTSLDVHTAWTEAQQGFPVKTQPLTMVSYEVNCVDLYDLTDPRTMLSLGYEDTHLSCAWEYDLLMKQIPASWKMSSELISEGICGIIVPSFAKGVQTGAKNIVFWDWTCELPHKVKVIDDEDRLPKNQISWE